MSSSICGGWKQQTITTRSISNLTTDTSLIPPIVRLQLSARPAVSSRTCPGPFDLQPFERFDVCRCSAAAHRSKARVEPSTRRVEPVKSCRRAARQTAPLWNRGILDSPPWDAAGHPMDHLSFYHRSGNRIETCSTHVLSCDEYLHTLSPAQVLSPFVARVPPHRSETIKGRVGSPLVPLAYAPGEIKLPLSADEVPPVVCSSHHVRNLERG